MQNSIIKNNTIILISTLGLIALFFIIYPLPYTIPKNTSITSILVDKSKRELYLYSNNTLIKSYHITLGFRPKGKKHFQGDGKTPEGKYYIVGKNSQSIAYKSLRISYPNKVDRDYALKRGKDPGGDIMIHGVMNSYKLPQFLHRFYDWTGGCIAVTNKEMDELFNHIKIGCPVIIQP